MTSEPTANSHSTDTSTAPDSTTAPGNTTPDSTVDVWAMLLDPQTEFSLPDFAAITAPTLREAAAEAGGHLLGKARAIVADESEPTFATCTVRLESATVPLSRLAAVVRVIESNHLREELRESIAEVRATLSETQTRLLLDTELFHRLEQVPTTDLNPEDKRHHELTLDEFVRAGARLGEEEREQMATIAAELTSLSTSFSRALDHDTRDLAVHVDSADDLDGLSEDAIAAAAQRAADRGVDGHLLPLNNYSQQLVLASLQNPQTRARVLENSLARGARGGEGDTRRQVSDITALRALQAKLLGYSSYSAFAIDNQTAGGPDAAADIVTSLISPAGAQLSTEVETLQSRYGLTTIAPADLLHLIARYRQDEYGVDPGEVARYFEFTAVLTEGVFRAATGLYGIGFRPREDLGGWHEDVTAYEVLDADEKTLGLVLIDPYARDTKRGGAWMDQLVSASRLTGLLPVVTLSTNLAKPAEGRPTLLSPTELTTLFHEFGHVLHGLFANSTYPSQAGTAVPRDYVEFPSQLNEMWRFHPQVLPHYAKHVDTGAAMPAEMVEALIAGETFGQGFHTIEYLAAAMLDLSWHSLEAGDHISDVLSFESEVLAAAGFTELVPPRYRSTYFGHVFASGYAAGYYSYLYSEVIAAWVSEWFEDQGGLDREAGDAFREAILAPGYSVDPMSAIERFFGTRPDVAPLLRRRGLAEPQETTAEVGPGSPTSPRSAAVPDSLPVTSREDLHPRNLLVAEALEACGITPRITVFATPATTAAAAADEIGVEVGAIANSLIFSTEGRPVLIMTSGAHRVDTEHVAEQIGLDSLDRADKDLVRESTGQIIGGVAPTGHPAPIPTYVDVALRNHPVVWASAGTSQSMMPLSYDELLRITNGQEITVERG